MSVVKAPFQLISLNSLDRKYFCFLQFNSSMDIVKISAKFAESRWLGRGCVICSLPCSISSKMPLVPSSTKGIRRNINRYALMMSRETDGFYSFGVFRVQFADLEQAYIFARSQPTHRTLLTLDARQWTTPDTRGARHMKSRKNCKERDVVRAIVRESVVLWGFAFEI